jgi:putative FmdB family regulatory protein
LALAQLDCQPNAGLGLRGMPRLPTYEYHCDSCDENFDVVQSFHDDPLTACPTCGSPVRKVFGNVGIVFKGGGFYKTDSRTKSSERTGSGSSSASSDSASGGSNSTDGSGKGTSSAQSGDSGSTPPASKEKSTTESSKSGSGGQGKSSASKD